MAVLDNTSPTGPYILDPTTQASMVQAYFVGAGLPADQVAGVGAYYQVGGGGPMTAAPVSKPIQVTSINSTLSRAINGVRVVESFAWAKMTTSGDVDMESVFWPPIDSAVVDAAVSFKAQMVDPVAHAAFLQSLGGVAYHDGGVVIHHTNAAIHSAPTAYVSYDVVTSPGSSAAARHFDQSGKDFLLPQETARGPAPGQKN